MKELHQRTDLLTQVLDHIPDLCVFEKPLPDIAELEGWNVRSVIDPTDSMGKVAASS